MEIKLILCTTNDFLVGDACPTSKNGMSWHSNEELQYFKQCTLGHTVVFGENTAKLVPLELIKKDRNVEILNFKNNWKSIINKYKNTDEIIFICGGYSVYTWFLEKCIENNFSYPYNLSELYLSILSDNVKINPVIRPLYLNIVKTILPFFSSYKMTQYKDFNAYVYKK